MKEKKLNLHTQKTMCKSHGKKKLHWVFFV